ncbi:hypothetical protein JQ629_36290 [Bradyrhizobium sp. AUGA SZCCT0222]|uniref:hypothetical protein n=1 Tax=Bradyrhizobium sp. AUGA SZCCT0222 TaxID=2807668 RepID=UPI001BA4D7C6|nr:hypothetical protein [Bradyrhizobium sp. AUGA SZCCT0222]MBR1272941.1 hypothetical protein [Bradyrhizobium sp. AUGA SZCCT0222]
MSNIKRIESLGELTDDNLAVVVGGRPKLTSLALARQCWKDGDLVGAYNAITAWQASRGGPFI